MKSVIKCNVKRGSEENKQNINELSKNLRKILGYEVNINYKSKEPTYK